MALITIVAAESETADRLTGWLATQHVVSRLRRWPVNGANADVVIYVADEHNGTGDRPRPEDFRRPGMPGLIITGRMHDAPRWAAQASSDVGPVRTIFPLAPVALLVAIRSILRERGDPRLAPTPFPIGGTVSVQTA
jgi:hypothetical protein